MSNTKKSAFKSVNAWATVLTLAVGVLGTFGISPDVADANQVTEIGNDISNAIETKNWYLAGAIAIQSLNFIYHTFIKPIIGK